MPSPTGPTGRSSGPSRSIAIRIWSWWKRRAAAGECPFPYRTGLLSFREIPILAAALGRLQSRPEVILVDGQGIAHPRGLGLASHLGLVLDVPTIGAAKSRLVGAGAEPELAAGSS